MYPCLITVENSENNNATVNGHPAWASEYDLATNTFRTMDVLSNSFCAGGTVLGNGTWLNAGEILLSCHKNKKQKELPS